MATILLSAAGAAAGASLGGGVMGLSSVVIGRAIGASLGRAIDEGLLGGAQAVERGKVERFRLTGAGEGAPVPRVYGRYRLGGHVIWASPFEEIATSHGGGKGGGPTVTEFSYRVSLAIALAEGVIGRVGRVWADGTEIAADSLEMRVYPGDEAQLPDPKIAAVEGAEAAPAYRGIAYVVIEDLDLSRWGNRVPQFSFELVRAAPGGLGGAPDLAASVPAVAMIPGTGEYALATTRVHFEKSPGVAETANAHGVSGRSDFAESLDMLRGEAPGVGAVSLVVSWFGDDLRCGQCRVVPQVEQAAHDGVGMPWRAGGIGRAEAGLVPQDGGRSVYGGTPADAAVLEAIAAMRGEGLAVTFYPFLLMQQLAGNGLPDPYGGAEQAALPWRGRITTGLAPGQEGSSDGTAAAEAEVAAFFGTAAAGDFSVADGVVSYHGPEEWGWRRFILHYAHLCAAAGGVDGFCIGSELRGLTRIRGADGGFPAVAALKALAAEVRGILGPDVKIGYAADWSEYFGYHPQDGSGDVLFHLDPLWSDPEIDFIGIDNYMPVADWRDGEDHADFRAGWRSIHDLDYLKANIGGGEGYDWYYHAPEAEAVQKRTPITDGAHGEPWVYRWKDLKSWWSLPHHERVGGQRMGAPTDWVPGSKPIWFTELGCAAIDKGANQPNRFLDPKSSESGLPRFSSGRRDDLMQMQYFRAQHDYWSDPANNPVSELYGGTMLRLDRCFAWAWDARPWPSFPGRDDLWADAGNYGKGHWLNGRIASRALGPLVREIAGSAGVDAVETGALHGLVRGYLEAEPASARAALEPLMLAAGFDAAERGGRLVFRSRDGRVDAALEAEGLAVMPGADDGALRLTRAAEPARVGRLRLVHVADGGSYETGAAEAIFPGEGDFAVSQTELPLLLGAGEAQGITERWLAEARLARDRAGFALPPSRGGLGPGDVVALDGARWRLDRVTRTDLLECEAVRVEPGIYAPSDAVEDLPRPGRFVPPLPVLPVFLDLPLLKGDEIPHAPHLAVTADPWPGAAALWSGPLEGALGFDRQVTRRAVVGETLTELPAAPAGRWDRGGPLRVRLISGALESVTEAALFAGANAMAIGAGDDDTWEVLQFRDAALVAPGEWDLSMRLRGQAGTDGAMPPLWPVGSRVVLLTPALVQLNLPLSARGLARRYRIGPAGRPVDDPVYRDAERAFDGVGLRPYAPVHLQAEPLVGGGHRLRWVRRTRIGGDSWADYETPLGEAREAYALRIFVGGALVREAEVTAPEWVYDAASQAGDGALGGFRLEVAQISESWGPGPFRQLDVTP